MLRAIASVLVGYAVMFVVVAISFTALHLGLGTEQVFKPGSWEASSLFISLALLITAAAAVIGGITSRGVAQSMRGPLVLAGVVLLLGLLSAAMALGAPPPGPREGDVTPMQAAANSRQPMWYAFTIPFLGAAGVCAGAALIDRRRDSVRAGG